MHLGVAAGLGARAQAQPGHAVARALRTLNTNSRFHYAAHVEFAEMLLATMPAGSVLVDCTSGDPATSRRMAARRAFIAMPPQ